ncbi:PEGA domain-containing protein [bacterium]|nr:MAG: PEGA domain-containing protein [bacterium]
MHNKLILIIGFFLFTSILNAQKKTVGVLELKNTGGITSNESSALTNRFRAMLVQTESFVVLERDKMNEILKEQDFISSDNCNTAECAVQIGQLLGVEKMIGGDIGKVGNTYTIDMRIVDVKTGAIEKSVSNDFKGEVDGLLNLMNEVSGVFAGISAQMKTISRSGTADVYVSSNPEGAEIFVDNNSTGLRSPALVEGLAPGFHTIHLKKDGLVGSQFLELIEGSIPSILVELTRPKVSVKLLSNPIGAFVLSGKDSLGKTPMVYTVPIGEAEIKLFLPGYLDTIVKLSLKEADAGRVINVEMGKADRMYIQTNPSSARVYIDKKLVGYSPCTVPVMNSSQELIVEATDYYTYRKILTGSDNPNIQIALISKNTKWKASITINSNPQNASIYLQTFSGSELIGETPLTRNWKEGANKITLHKKGYKNISVEIAPYHPVIDIELEPE